MNELHVGESTYRSDYEILGSWRKHFGELATQSSNPLFDEKYKILVERELLEIIDLHESSSDQYDAETEQELADALCSLNKGKAADIYGLTTEHLSIYLFTLQHPLTSIMCSCAVSARIKARF